MYGRHHWSIAALFPPNQGSAPGLVRSQPSRQPVQWLVAAPNEIRFFIQSQESSSPLLPTTSLNFTSRNELHKLQIAVRILFQPSICRRTHPRENRSLRASELGFLHTRLETPCGQRLCSPRARESTRLPAGAELNDPLHQLHNGTEHSSSTCSVERVLENEKKFAFRCHV